MENKSVDIDNIDFKVDFNNFNPEDIMTEETINCVFVVDVSGSVKMYESELNTAFNEFIQEMQKSHVADRLLVSIIEFDDTVRVRSGFQPISAIQRVDFDAIGNATAIYDATSVGLKNAIDYRTNLEKTGVKTKTILYILTDGHDNWSKTPASDIKKQIADFTAQEKNMFTFTSILFGIGTGDKNSDPNYAAYQAAQKDMGIQNLAYVGNSAKEIRKMINIISSSISSTSNNQSVTF